MLVAFGASVARDAGDAVFAGTLARGLVTGLAGSSHGMAIALCGGNTQQEGQGRGQRVQAASQGHWGAGREPRVASGSLGMNSPSLQPALDLQHMSCPASDHTDQIQRWHLAKGVYMGVTWVQRW